MTLRDTARNALTTPPSMTEMDEAIFGTPGNGSLDQLESGRIVARPTPIMAIWADVKQPRRAIPISIRMHWDGSPLDVPELLHQWRLVAEKQAGVTFDIEAMLKGEGEGLDADKYPSLTQEYISLVRLAQGIKADGLINPITIIENDGKQLIESGERRWLAFHLLNTHLGDQWAKVPAAKGNFNDSVWRQASENTQRRALNPIGMARQIALLIMESRSAAKASAGPAYKTYEEMVAGGQSDRRYYAQVADGVLHRIPIGMGERIQGAMQLGREQLSQYRRLLRLTDDEQINDVIWTRADVENWSENAMREVGMLTAVNIRQVIERDKWELDDLRALKEAERPAMPPPLTTPAIPRRPVTSEWMNKTVITKGGLFCSVIAVDGDWITVTLPDGNRKKIHYTELTFASDRPGGAPVMPTPRPAPTPQYSNSIPGFGHDFHIGDWVRTRTGSEGEVMGLSGRLVSVRTKNGTNSHDHSLLVKIATPIIDEDAIEDDVDPDVPAPVPEWREGWTDGDGGNNQTDSDKASSQTQPVEPKHIIKTGSSQSVFLSNMLSMAMFSNNSELAMILKDLIDLTDVQAIALADTQTLKPKLDQAYDVLEAEMQNWLQGHFADVLQSIVNAAQ